MLKLALPVVLVLSLAAAGTGIGLVVANRGESVDEILPPSVVQGSPTPIVPAVPTPTPTPTSIPTPQPTPTPAPDDWTTYVDPQLGFSFPHPQGLAISEEFFVLFGKDDDSTVRMRALTFRDASGVRVLDLGITPNPDSLSLQDWMNTYDPCASSLDPSLPQPESMTIAGEPGILCPIDQLGQRNPRIYLQRGGDVFVLIANVYGIPESGFPPALSEADFQRVIDGFSLGL